MCPCPVGWCSTLWPPCWACRASVAAAAQLTPVVSEGGVVCLPAELATLTCTRPPGTAPILPGDPGACEGPWMDGWMVGKLMGRGQLHRSCCSEHSPCSDEGWCPSCLTPCSLLCHLLADINELKVFVDLASISAGENDMDVDRVACFHGTVHGYSSLLYELRHDSGFEDFMRCLQKLWRALDSDETLPQKLVSSAGPGPLHPAAFLPFQEQLEVGLHWGNGTCVRTALQLLLVEEIYI